MHRRALLARAGALAATGLAGCLSGGPGEGGEGGDDEELPGGADPPDDATDTETETETVDGVELADASLTILDVECGQERDEATVAFDEGETAVEVTGTVWGADACKIPELRDATYDEGADELTVTVGTTGRDRDGGGADACAECISELEYRVTADFRGGLPDEVVVRHDHGDGPETVETATAA